jgi:hypothetical protein
MKDALEEKDRIYPWTRSDKALHALPALPLIIFYVVTIYFLALHSWYLSAIFIVFWLATNLSATRICAGCPYRGAYCPGLCQLFIAPFLSLILFRKAREKGTRQSFKGDLILLGIFGIGGYLFAFCCLFILYWPNYAVAILVLLGLLILNMVLSFFLLCPKCGYNQTCPMAKVHKAFQ